MLLKTELMHLPDAAENRADALAAENLELKKQLESLKNK